MDGKYEFQCHHGELECTGNKVQACALKILTPEKAVNYINCLMEIPNNQTSNSTGYPDMSVS